MKTSSNNQMSIALYLVRQTVKIKVPEVDRITVDVRTLLAVVLQVVDGDSYHLDIQKQELSI